MSVNVYHGGTDKIVNPLSDQTYADLHDRSTGLYLYGDRYVADEYMREINLN